ncbi:MAG: hypothetical protein M1368_02645, partial [Thaumarchaeota archaeon]|nr:hypothetical protein [Nitrososphaerota archaeon]
DRGMAVLGESTCRAIFWRIERNNRLKHEEIPRKPEQFIRVLEEMFGPGAKLLEGKIVEEMKAKFSAIPDRIGSFEESVNEAARGRE